jgi:hypothetical protein
MGLNSHFVRCLVNLKRSGKLDGATRVIEIGAQQLSNDLLRALEDTDQLFREFGATPISLGVAASSQAAVGITENLPDQAPSSRAMWEHIGLKYSALDFDGHRDSIAIDLNRDAIPRRLRGAFDLVVNAGTTEHVANQDKCFQGDTRPRKSWRGHDSRSPRSGDDDPRHVQLRSEVLLAPMPRK